MTNTTQTVAATILQQLGGSRFVAMTGARNLVESGRALTLTINGRTADGRAVNRVGITLSLRDTYVVQTYFVRGLAVRPIDERCDFYCDQLRGVFETLTGLRTSL
jgi:hypothetical protein